MGNREDLLRRLHPLLADAESFGELEEMLVSNSNLPGPRGNLELASAFADSFAAITVGDAPWQLLRRWIDLSPEEAPTGDPREFLPFCALQALGSLYQETDGERREEIVHLLRASAGDRRWRVREGVAIAFQRIAERDFPAVRDLFSEWIEGASFLDQRAMVAALAHPPILGSADTASYCLQVSGQILGKLLLLEGESRRTEPFRVLRQGLEYALSVFVAALPEEGFAFLKRWAREEDADIKRILRSNAGKARLRKKYPGEVDRLLAML